MAVEVLAGRHGEAVVLLGGAFGAGFKLLFVLVGPPLAHVAVEVVLGALVIKAVRHLVADDHADATEIDRRIQAVVIERRLKDAGREVDVVLRRVVVRVDRGRGHAPFGGVYRLAELVQIALPFEVGSAQDVAGVVVALDLDRAVVLPVIRVANLIGDGI